MTDAVRWQFPAALVVSALALTACAPEDAAKFEEGEPAAAEEPTQDPTEEQSDESTPAASAESNEGADESRGSSETLVAEVDDPVVFEECEEAEESDEATVTWLEDVVFPEETLAEAVPGETMGVNGEQVELPGAPAVVLPERVGQAGCIIEYSTPGGCISGFQISDAFIPGYVLPERTLPGFELPEGTVVEELTQNRITVDPVHIAAVSADQVCQDDEDAETGDTVWGVTRWGETRWGSTQWGETAWGETRWAEETAGGAERTPSMSLNNYSSDSMSLDSVSVDSQSLESYKLDGAENTERAGEDESVSYTTEGDVLFDSDEYELRADAESELQAVADDIAQRDDDYVIEVEGHTDDLPTSVYDDNYKLSELRAESVVDWLIDNAEVDESTISAEGLGEDYPRTENDSDEGRQQNRRVVITVQPEDYDPEADYELEDAGG